MSDTNLLGAVSAIALFKGDNLRTRISGLEKVFRSKTRGAVSPLLSEEGLSSELLRHALVLKEASSQIDVVVHSLGLLRSLPVILDEDERIESLSLGAGNTGRPFDLETDRRVAEFKFIKWKGSDSVRESSLFKDFYELAEYPTSKRKCLYVVGIDLPARFLKGGRSCESVLDKHKKTWKHLSETYGNSYGTVGEYFRFRGETVEMIDLGELLPDLNLLEA